MADMTIYRNSDDGMMDRVLECFCQVGCRRRSDEITYSQIESVNPNFSSCMLMNRR